MDIQTITNQLAERVESDGSVDQIQLIQQVTDITRITSFLYSLLSGIILMIVPFIVAVEIVYLCFPIMRENLEKLSVKFEGSGVANKTFGIVLRDAREAVTRAQTIMTGQSALLIYMKIKFKSLMVVMFIVCLVLQGTPEIIRIVMNFIGAILETIW